MSESNVEEGPETCEELLQQVQGQGNKLEKLNFGFEGKSFNEENKKEFDFLLQALRLVPKLKELSFEIKDSALSPGQVRDIFEEIAKMTGLQSLEFDISNNEFSQEGATAIGDSISRLVNLGKLSMNVGLYTGINAGGIAKICQGISNILGLTELSLDFSTNEIGIEGAESLNKLLLKQKNLTNLTLNLEQCSFNQEIIKSLSNGISSLGGLTNIELSFKTSDLQSQQVQELSYNLLKLKNIEEANLVFDYTVIQSEGLKSICILINGWKKLQSLELSVVDCSLDPQAATYLQNISQLESLEKFILQIGENHQTEESAKFIGDALSQMVGLKELTVNLNSEKIKDQGCKSICKGIEKLTQLEILFLKFCGGELQKTSGQYIGQCVQKLTVLNNLKLDLSVNDDLGAEGILAIKQGVSELKTLQEFTLQVSCKQDNKTISEVQTAIRSYKQVHIEKTELQLNGLALSRKNSFSASKSTTRQQSGIKNQKECPSHQSQNSKGSQGCDKDRKIKALQEKLETKNDILIAVISIAVMIILLLGFLLVCPRYRNLFSKKQVDYSDDDYDNGYGEGDIDDYIIDPKYYSAASDAEIFDLDNAAWSD